MCETENFKFHLFIPFSNFVLEYDLQHFCYFRMNRYDSNPGHWNDGASILPLCCYQNDIQNEKHLDLIMHDAQMFST